jgi:hypothetical protein
MSDVVEHAIELLRQMPKDRQDLLARMMLHEIEEDERWLRSTDSSADKLQGLVNRVLEPDDLGECELLDPDKL